MFGTIFLVAYQVVPYFLVSYKCPILFYFLFFLTSIVPKNEFMLLDSAGFICANDQLFYGFAELIV